MKIINIEESVFEQMMECFESFTRKVDKLCSRKNEKNLQKWLDNQDVCQILNISKRTLQNYRDNGTLAYTQIGHKIYYKPEDIQQIIPLVYQKETEKKERRTYDENSNQPEFTGRHMGKCKPSSGSDDLSSL